MFERFTEDACRALFFPRAQATRRGNAGIDLADPAGGALRVMAPAACEGFATSQPIAAVADRIACDRPSRGPVRDVAHVPFGASTSRALHAAAALADRHHQALGNVGHVSNRTGADLRGLEDRLVCLLLEVDARQRRGQAPHGKLT